MHFRERRMRRVRDFHRTRISNPFFARPHPSGLRRTFRTVLFLILAIGILYGGIYSPLLRIVNVTVSGAGAVPSSQVAAAAKQALAGYRFGVIPRDHFFALQTRMVERAVMAVFPFRTVQVVKKLHTLVLSVEERESSFRLVEPNASYLLDQDGVVLREDAQPVAGSSMGEGEKLIALKRDNTSTSIVLGESIYPPAWSPFINNLHKYFATQVGVRDVWYTVKPQDGTIKATTVEGWYAIFDFAVDLQSQLDALSVSVVSKFGPDERKKLDYIDVRFGDRVFYKWR